MNSSADHTVLYRERNMSRTTATILFCLVAILLAGGCNKTDGKKKIDTSNVEETAPALTAVPEAKPRDVTDEEAAIQRAEQMREDIRTELIAMVPEYGFSYDSASDKLSGEGLPDGGVPVPPLIDKLEKRAKEMLTTPGKEQYQQMARVMLTQFQSAGASAVDTSSETASFGSSDSAPVDDSVNEYGLKKATKAYGEWRSIREEGPKYTIDHDDNYYKLLLVYYDRNAQFSTFAKGQRIKHAIYDYRFDRGKSELKLTAEDGSYTMDLQCFVRDSEPGLMYVKQSGEAYTVYEKIGRGEEPYTEEEKQAFLEASQGGKSTSTGGQ